MTRDVTFDSKYVKNIPCVGHLTGEKGLPEPNLANM